jgi:hypothetical protein
LAKSALRSAAVRADLGRAPAPAHRTSAGRNLSIIAGATMAVTITNHTTIML